MENASTSKDAQTCPASSARCMPSKVWVARLGHVTDEPARERVAGPRGIHDLLHWERPGGR